LSRHPVEQGQTSVWQVFGKCLASVWQVFRKYFASISQVKVLAWTCESLAYYLPTTCLLLANPLRDILVWKEVPITPVIVTWGLGRVCGGADHGAKIGIFRVGKTVRNVF